MTYTIVPSFPGNPACSALRALDLEPSEQRSLFLALSAGARVVNLPLTFPVALPTVGFTGFDSPPREEVPGPLPLATPSKVTSFPAQNALFATNSIHEHDHG